LNDRVMGDSTTLTDIPLTVDAAASYLSGTYAISRASMEERFPHIAYGHCWIDSNGTRPDADARDWETGDKEGSLEQWVADHNAHTGQKDAIVYCNRSTIPEVRQLTGRFKLGLDYWLWVACLDGTMYTGPGVKLCQRDGEAQTGGHWDRSFIFGAKLFLPAKRPVTHSHNCRLLQKAVGCPVNNIWDRVLDKRCGAVRHAAQTPPTFPWGTEFAQRVVRTKVDDIWGPNSEAACKEMVAAIQSALTQMGFDTHGVDGIWGPNTERAYRVARAADHI
jgi:hypothetical protein